MWQATADLFSNMEAEEKSKSSAGEFMKGCYRNFSNVVCLSMGDNNDKKTGAGSKIDRLVMGIILGGAIGSVLGLTLAPRKGEETRQIIKDKSKELIEKGKEVSSNLIRDHKETIQGAAYQIKKGRGFLRWLFSGKQKTREPMPRSTLELPDEND